MLQAKNWTSEGNLFFMLNKMYKNVLFELRIIFIWIRNIPDLLYIFDINYIYENKSKLKFLKNKCLIYLLVV